MSGYLCLFVCQFLNHFSVFRTCVSASSSISYCPAQFLIFVLFWIAFFPHFYVVVSYVLTVSILTISRYYALSEIRNHDPTVRTGKVWKKSSAWHTPLLRLFQCGKWWSSFFSLGWTSASSRAGGDRETSVITILRYLLATRAPWPFNSKTYLYFYALTWKGEEASIRRKRSWLWVIPVLHRFGNLTGLILDIRYNNSVWVLLQYIFLKHSLSISFHPLHYLHYFHN